MASPLSPTLGIWLIAQLLQAMYFFWYPTDRRFTKTAVILITVFETAQTGFFFGASYELFIDGFGQFGPNANVPWEAGAQLLALTLSTFVAQEYFAHTLFLVGNRRIIYPLFVALLGVASFGKCRNCSNDDVTFAEIGKTSASLNAQAATALACDFCITVGLCWRLNTSRTGIQSTNKLINFLIMTSINRGVFTMLFAMLNIIMWLTKPEAFYFLMMNIICGKFYMNSMLAILNTREHAQSLGQVGTLVTSTNIAMNTLHEPRARMEPIDVNVTVAKETVQSSQFPVVGTVQAFRKYGWRQRARPSGSGKQWEI
ncbi:hypothetical protein B0H17DRAFT_1223193 [Mycena rosella]|uniref:DUF6534 domain-containing protein n=1 Tax=Mycena rosella TaxID=1033263 RepID=A0AAD7AWD9_MYCRO|nr:hypothetical protein B0H17DRAFT_1223193 [Mycena rosella]